MLKTLDHELIVISDVHLVHEKDERGSLLLSLLSLIDFTRVRYLVFLGDIFDFCFGSSLHFQRKFSTFGEELTRLSANGVSVFFVEGNHEFFLDRLPWSGVKFIRGKELLLTLSDGKTISFVHGDSIEAPWHYRLYSHIIRSATSQFFALKVPQNYLDPFALYISRQSRKKSYSLKINHKKILVKILRWLESQSANIGIVGHFHIPYDAISKDTNQRILGLPSWDQPNCLSFDKGNFYRIYFEGDESKILPLS